MSPMVVNISADELRMQRDQALERVGMTEKQLRARVKSGALTGAEWDALEVLDRVTFLLGEN